MKSREFKLCRQLVLAGAFSLAGGWAAAEDGAPERLGGSLAGLRPLAASRGLEVGVDYTAEIFSVARGGLHRGAELEGLANLTLDGASSPSAGAAALTFHANLFATHGDSISDRRAGDAGHLSNIDFEDAVRLFECWLDCSWADTGWSIRAGQLALDSEFALDEPAAVFCHSDFGACGALSANVPVPIYAIAAPGVRLRFSRDDWYVQTAVYDGNPDPDTLGDPSPGFTPGGRKNLHGVTWHCASSEGALAIVETGWRRGDQPRLAGSVGAFYHTDTFSDQRFDHTGRVLADPASDGLPRGHRGDYGVYAVATGPLGRVGEGAVDGFVRVAAVPSDRNEIGASWETGLVATGLVSGRPRDVLALGVAALEWSGAARAAVRDRALWGDAAPVPDRELAVELTWRVELRSSWSVQPDVQWIRHPGGSAATGDVVAVGLRTYLSF